MTKKTEPKEIKEGTFVKLFEGVIHSAYLEKSFNDVGRGIRTLIEAENKKQYPNTTLISVLCDSARGINYLLVNQKKKDQEILSLKKSLTAERERAKSSERKKDKEIERLRKYEEYYMHILNHFKEEHPGWKVICKICNKTFEEIIKNQRTKVE